MKSEAKDFEDELINKLEYFRYSLARLSNNNEIIVKESNLFNSYAFMHASYYSIKLNDTERCKVYGYKYFGGYNKFVILNRKLIEKDGMRKYKMIFILF